MKYWLIWLSLLVVGGGYFGYELTRNNGSLYLPGASSDGHYQIELACDSCHGTPFEGTEGLQKSCVRCHAKELKQAEDSHPKSKFTDPRNADRLTQIDARYCVSCHVEHRQEQTMAMGVTLPRDFCFRCHQNVAKDRPSHQGMKFDGCDAAGCHNYHDNRALYEDFLVKHGRATGELSEQKLPARNLGAWFDQVGTRHTTAKIAPTAAQLFGESDYSTQEKAWKGSAHAKDEVICANCHTGKSDEATYSTACKECHSLEFKGFESGKHGMRLAQGLSPMKVSHARSRMRSQASDRHLNCWSCHDAHEANTRKAATEACLSCHDDEHSSNYKNSSHYRLWQKEVTAGITDGSGVSCAGCHMPRMEGEEKGRKRILVTHNQNMNLEPNEKMIRSVCLHCHTLSLSIDALADATLIKNNFSSAPENHVASIDMALKREKVKKSSIK